MELNDPTAVTPTGVAKVKWSAGALTGDVPSDVVTVTSTVATDSAGAVAVIWVALLIVKVVAATVPNLTPVAPVKLVPVMITEVPPAVVPVAGLTPVTVGGAGVAKVKWSAGALTGDVPSDVVTVTSTVAADSAGAVAVIWVALLTVMVVAATVPNLTPVAPVKLVPVMITEVPPAVVPVAGLTPVTVGGRGVAVIKLSMLPLPVVAASARNGSPYTFSTLRSTPAVLTGVASCWGLFCRAEETTRVTIFPPPPSPAVPRPEVSESNPSSHCTTIWPPAAYQDVDWTAPMNPANHVSPTVGTVLPSARVGPSCMSSRALGETQTKSGAPAAFRSLVTPALLVSGTVLVVKSDREVTAGK